MTFKSSLKISGSSSEDESLAEALGFKLGLVYPLDVLRRFTDFKGASELGSGITSSSSSLVLMLIVLELLMERVDMGLLDSSLGSLIVEIAGAIAFGLRFAFPDAVAGAPRLTEVNAKVPCLSVFGFEVGAIF